MELSLQVIRWRSTKSEIARRTTQASDRSRASAKRASSA
jgi:hypothetical protein